MSKALDRLLKDGGQAWRVEVQYDAESKRFIGYLLDHEGIMYADRIGNTSEDVIERLYSALLTFKAGA